MGALQAATAIVGLGTTIANRQAANQQLKQQYQLQANELAARQAETETSAKANLEIIQKTAEEREKKRLNLLKAELAKRRAAMGAAGVSGGGSAEAVRFGLAKASDQQSEFDLEMDRYRIDELTRNLDAKRRKNLMALTSLNSFSAADDLLNYGQILNHVTDIF